MKKRVMLCQLKAKQRHIIQKSWVVYDEVRPQLERCFALIEEQKPQLVVLPETCYIPQLYDTYKSLAQDCFIVAGSAYNDDGINETHMFGPNGFYSVVPKIFPSPKETMEYNHPNTKMPDLVLKQWEAEVERGEWPPYFPVIDEKNGQRLAVLNCMDYYRMGYFVANSSVISPHIWGIVSPCSNGQQEVFFRLAGAIHDANDLIYSFVVNSHNQTRPPGSTQGQSFVMGPITHNTKALLSLQTGQKDDHFAYIYKLGEDAEVLFLDLIDGKDVCFFARSKDFKSTPTNIQRVSLEEEVKL